MIARNLGGNEPSSSLAFTTILYKGLNARARALTPAHPPIAISGISGCFNVSHKSGVGHGET